MTALPRLIGPIIELAVKVMVWPGMGRPVPVFFNVALSTGMTNVPLKRTRMVAGVTVSVVLDVGMLTNWVSGAEVEPL